MKKQVTSLIIVLFFLNVFFLSSAAACEDHTLHSEEPWDNVYTDLISKKECAMGDALITVIEGNGVRDPKHKFKSRETIIFLPAATNFNQPIEFIFYFHGLGGFKERDFRTRTLRHTKNLKKNYILIIPELPWSHNTSTPRSRLGRIFTHKTHFPKFFEEIKFMVTLFYEKDIIVNKVVMLGHSAGGSVIQSISKSGGLNWLYEKEKIQQLQIIFSDASYGHWLDITWKHLNPRFSNINLLVLTRKGDRPYKHARRFLKKFKKKPANLCHMIFKRIIKHGEIGDQAFSWIDKTPILSDCGKGERNEQSDE